MCDGTTVRACHAGQLAEALQQCAPSLTCSQGRCISTACAKAEANQASLAGCTFYTFDLDNVTSDDSIPTSVLVTNPGQVVANASLERREAGLWTVVMTTPVPPMSSARIVLADSHLEGGGLAAAGAFRLTSDAPVMAAHIQSDDSTDQGSTSTGGTLLLPAHVLGRRYRVLTYVQVSTPRITVTPGAMHGAGQLLIVGTQDPHDRHDHAVGDREPRAGRRRPHAGNRRLDRRSRSRTAICSSCSAPRRRGPERHADRRRQADRRVLGEHLDDLRHHGHGHQLPRHGARAAPARGVVGHGLRRRPADAAGGRL